MTIEELRGPLERLGLIGDDEPIETEPLSGGVASDIWLVRAGGRSFVVKRALEKLRVAADWRAPVARNAAEAAWIRTAAAIVPGNVPKLLAHDPQAGLFAMEFLPPERFPVWKAQLRDGKAEPDFARLVGRQLGRVHAGTAGRPATAGEFNPDATFAALRLEPYFAFTAQRHPDLAPRLRALIDITLANKRVLVHGDVSPKNILVGEPGPVFLDAECAWYGDPAFDLAFCLTHLILKCVWNPAAAGRFVACFEVLVAAYLAEVDWEEKKAIESRVARLVPAIVLARIDGKSPVEYIVDDADRNAVRQFAIPFIRQPPLSLAPILRHWQALRRISS
jgi:aminoglycoside phosphotransferase (APT) family kinase protein